MNNETYNGWTNYETWITNLEIFDGLTSDDLFGRKCSGDDVEDYVGEIVGDVENGYARTCARIVSGEVNWNEIAEHLNED